MSLDLEDKPNIQIGDKALVFSQTFVVPDSVTAKITVPLESTPRGKEFLTVHVRFDPSRTEDKASWHVENNVFKLEFFGWHGQIGSSFEKPVRIGDVNGKPLGFTVAHQKVSDVNNLVTLQFYVGGAYE